MKKNIIILSVILAGALCFIFVLVGKSDPEKIVIDTTRRYDVISISPEDTFRLPGSLTAIRIEANLLFAYINKQKILYRYNLENRVTDTLLHSNTLFSGILSGVDMEPADSTFYFLNANSNRIYSFRSRDTRLDSLSLGKFHMAGGEKCFTGAGFLLRSIDDATCITRLKLADCSLQTDTTIYIFTQFKDGGISADGIFTKNKASKKEFYIPYYNAEIIQYDETNNKISKIITLDKTKPQNIAIPVGNGYGIYSKSRMINITATADSAHLYILSYTTSPGKDERRGTVVDIYSTISGQYESSLQFPYFEGNPVSLLERSGDRLYVAFNNSIISYKIKYP